MSNRKKGSITTYWWDTELSKWHKTFVFLPKTTVTGKKIWCTMCYTRRMIDWTFHVEVFDEYAADIFEMLSFKD